MKNTLIVISIIVISLGLMIVFSPTYDFREKDVYSGLKKPKEEIHTSGEKIIVSYEDAMARKKAAEEERKEKEKWERMNTDKIHYAVGRYSADGKFIVQGKYTLRPAHRSDMNRLHLSHQGYNPELDDKILVVDTSFFQGFPPDSQFDIYCVVWKKGSRDEVVRVDISHRDISRGW